MTNNVKSFSCSCHLYIRSSWEITQNILANKISVLHSWWKSMALCHNIIWGDGLVKTSVFSVSNHQYLPLYQIIEKLEYTSVWFHQKIGFQTLKALSISLKAFCKLVTSCCSLYGYFGAQRLLIGSRLWFSDTQHFTCTLSAFFIKQHFFLLFFFF